MAKQELRERAQKMRKEGCSIGEIVTTLDQSKSTVSYWCKNIALTSQQIETIKKAHSSRSVGTLLRAAELQRQERFARERVAAMCGKTDVGAFTTRDLFMLGLGLYWGEGYKYAHCEFGFTNSSPDMIRVYIRWLVEVYGVVKRDIVCRVSINITHAERVEFVEQYWRTVTGLPAEQFTKTSLIKSVARKVYKNQGEHYGTLRLKVRQGVGLRNRVMGSISAVTELCVTETLD